MWRTRMVFKDAEAEDVLTRLRLIGLNIRLEGEDRNKAIKVIESFLEQYQKCCWPILTIEISGAIRRELLKSMVIDVKMVSQVVDFLNYGGVVKKKKKKKKVETEKDSDGSSDEETDSDEEEDSDEEYNWKDEPDRYQGSDEEEEDSGFEDDSDDEEELKKAAEAAAAVAAAKEAAAQKELDDLKQPRRRKQCIEDLIRLSEEKGLSVKKGDEEEILDMMIPYIRGRGWYHHRIKIFLNRVREHIDRCSSLDNVDTVKTALETNEFSFEEDNWKIIEQIASNTSTTREEEDMADDAKDQVNHSLNKTVVPTKEEGVATPMNQIRQEENGDMMESEEQETLSPLNLPEPGKESMAGTYSSTVESLDRVGANKRKLAQIQPGY